MQNIRMKDTRDEEGTGSVIVEMEYLEGAWSTLNQMFFWKGVPQDIDIHNDNIETINILQITKPRFTWKKTQKHNKPHPYGRFYNFTVLRREDTTPKKCERDC